MSKLFGLFLVSVVLFTGSNYASAHGVVHSSAYGFYGYNTPVVVATPVVFSAPTVAVPAYPSVAVAAPAYSVASTAVCSAPQVAVPSYAATSVCSAPQVAITSVAAVVPSYSVYSPVAVSAVHSYGSYNGIVAVSSFRTANPVRVREVRVERRVVVRSRVRH